jgi:hypothetical protein
MGAAVRDLQNIRLSVGLQSPDNEEKLRERRQVWQERCPIYLALTKPVAMTCQFHINSVEAARLVVCFSSWRWSDGGNRVYDSSSRFTDPLLVLRTSSLASVLFVICGQIDLSRFFRRTLRAR